MAAAAGSTVKRCQHRPVMLLAELPHHAIERSLNVGHLTGSPAHRLVLLVERVSGFRLPAQLVPGKVASHAVALHLGWELHQVRRAWKVQLSESDLRGLTHRSRFYHGC